jgi:hypothetical protein
MSEPIRSTCIPSRQPLPSMPTGQMPPAPGGPVIAARILARSACLPPRLPPQVQYQRRNVVSHRPPQPCHRWALKGGAPQNNIGRLPAQRLAMGRVSGTARYAYSLRRLAYLPYRWTSRHLTSAHGHRRARKLATDSPHRRPPHSQQRKNPLRFAGFCVVCGHARGARGTLMQVRLGARRRCA